MTSSMIMWAKQSIIIMSNSELWGWNIWMSSCEMLHNVCLHFLSPKEALLDRVRVKELIIREQQRQDSIQQPYI